MVSKIKFSISCLIFSLMFAVSELRIHFEKVIRAERSYVVFDKDSVTWSQAFAQCRRKGMELVSIESKEENDFIKNLIWMPVPPETISNSAPYRLLDLRSERPKKSSSSTDFWTSGRKGRDGRWIWASINRTIDDWTDWAVGQPRVSSSDGRADGCLMMTARERLKWSAHFCQARLPYICQSRSIRDGRNTAIHSRLKLQGDAVHFERIAVTCPLGATDCLEGHFNSQTTCCGEDETSGNFEFQATCYNPHYRDPSEVHGSHTVEHPHTTTCCETDFSAQSTCRNERWHGTVAGDDGWTENWHEAEAGDGGWTGGPEITTEEDDEADLWGEAPSEAEMPEEYADWWSGFEDGHHREVANRESAMQEHASGEPAPTSGLRSSDGDKDGRYILALPEAIYTFHVKEPISWDEALLACKHEDAALANIPDGQHNLRITEFLSIQGLDKQDFWLGGRLVRVPHKQNTRNVWLWWNTGQPIQKFNWAPGRPIYVNDEERCLVLLSDSDWQWTNDVCSHRHPYACQRPGPANLSFIHQTQHGRHLPK